MNKLLLAFTITATILAQQAKSNPCSALGILGTGTVLSVLDCTKYYTCVLGVATENSCLGGLVYSPALGLCVLPGLSICLQLGNLLNISLSCDYCKPTTTTTTTTTEPTTPNPCDSLGPLGTGPVLSVLDCTEYYTCVNGVATPHYCTGGLVYSSLLNTCVLPGTEVCLKIGEILNITITCDECFPYTTTTTTTTEPTTPNPCDSLGPLGTGPVLSVLDCTEYYTCVNGVATPHYCTGGLVYSSLLKTCVLPGTEVCLKIGEILNITITCDECFPYTTTTTTTTEPTTPNPCDSLGPLGTGPVLSVLDCTEYYTCVNGVATPHYCTGGLVYSSLLKTCVLPGTEVCLKIGEILNITITCDECFPYTTTTTTTTEPTTPNPCDSLGPLGTGPVLSVLDCTEYYTCVNGVATPHYCTGGLVYSSLLKTCVLPGTEVCLKIGEILNITITCDECFPYTTTTTYPTITTIY